MADYHVGISRYAPIDLEDFAGQFDIGRLIDKVNPRDISLRGTNLFITTNSRSALWVTGSDFNYPFEGISEERNILDAIASALDIAVLLENQSSRFNPNQLKLTVGHFPGEEAFKKDFAPVAGKLQRTLYGRGDVSYAETSNEYIVFLGTGYEADTKADFGVRKIQFEGTARPADSLDELLRRIKQG